MYKKISIIILILLAGCYKHDITLLEHTPPSPILIPATMPSEKTILCMDDDLRWAEPIVYQTACERYSRFAAMIAHSVVEDGELYIVYGNIKAKKSHVVEYLSEEYKNRDILLFVDNEQKIDIQGNNIHYFKSKVFDIRNQKLLVNIWSISK